MELTRAEHDDIVFPELYKNIDYSEYDKETERLEKEKAMTGFNVVKQTTREVVVKVDNGVTLSGTPLQVTRSLEALGFKNVNFGKTYNSSTNGPVLISTMPTSHIANALVKKIRTWATALDTKNTENLIVELDKLDFPFWDDEFKNLFSELCDRTD